MRLTDHQFLRVLNAANNKISDLSKLKGCTKLEKLLLQGNDVLTIDSLPQLDNLRQLTLRDDESSNPLYDDPNAESVDSIDAALLDVIAKRWPTVFIFNGGHTVSFVIQPHV